MVKCHNHLNNGINDPELLHFRSGKSKSIFMNVQNPCLQPPYLHTYSNEVCHSLIFDIGCFSLFFVTF